MSIKLLTWDVYQSGMHQFKELADEKYQDKATLPQYYMSRVADSEVPAGYDTAYHLIYNIPNTTTRIPMGAVIGIKGSKGGGVIQSYIVGATPYAANWLSDVTGGPPFVPSDEFLYVILSSGDECNNFYRWDSVANEYVLVAEGSGGGAIFAYIVSGAPTLAVGWLTDTPGGTALDPKEGCLYLVLTPGKFYNNIYRFDNSTNKYILVADANDHDVMFVYEVSGATEFSAGWLSETSGGTALTPVTNKLYVDLTTTSKYYNYTFRFDSGTNAYVMTSGGGAGSGAIMCYTIAGKTPLNKDWLTDDSTSTTPLDPEEGPLYLVLSAGEYYSNVFRYDATTRKYVLVVNARVKNLTKAEYLALSSTEQNDGTIYFITDSAASVPSADDYLPSRVTAPTTPIAGSVILWKGAISGDFTVSPAIYKYNGTRWERQDLGIEGQTIQVDTMPAASVALKGKIYQYIGTTTGTFKHGYFYECVEPSTGTYAWKNADVQDGGVVITKADFDALPQSVKDNGTVYYITDGTVPGGGGESIQFDPLPTASADLVGKVYQYIGTTNANFTHNYWYECREVTTGNYAWVYTPVQDGKTIQVTSMPAASSDLVGVVYQYIGATNANYTHNYFYECYSPSSGTYAWKNVKVQDGEKIQFITLPTATADLVGTIYQFIGTTDANYKHGYFYECYSPSAGNYAWKNVSVQDGETIQLSTMPSPTSALSGKIYQYVGADGGGFINGYFYECIESSTPGTYIWLNKDVQLGGHQIKSGTTSFLARPALNFTGLDVADDSTDEETDVKAHELTTAEFDEIFSQLPEANDDKPVYDQRGNEHLAGKFIASDGTIKDVFEKWFELTIPLTTSNSMTDLLVSVGCNVDQFVEIKGIAVMDGWYTGIGFGVSSAGLMLVGYDNSDTSGNANKCGVFYQGDITGFDRIFVIARYTKVTS